MDDIRTSIILEKNELMYLINYSANGGQNINAAILAEFTGVVEADNHKAVKGLIQKNIINLVDNKIVIVKLFDFYLKKLLGAESNEIIDNGAVKAVFYNSGFILLVEGHKLSQNHISIRAFKTKEDLFEALKEVDGE